jgi:hypothetical protein
MQAPGASPHNRKATCCDFSFDYQRYRSKPIHPHRDCQCSRETLYFDRTISGQWTSAFHRETSPLLWMQMHDRCTLNRHSYHGDSALR